VRAAASLVDECDAVIAVARRAGDVLPETTTPGPAPNTRMAGRNRFAVTT